MVSRLLVLLAGAGIVAGCATTRDPGWRGQGAEPFDQALAECEQKASIVSDKENREHLLADCMGAKGWHRPVR